MLKIYGQYRSRAFRVIWLCKESSIPYEHVDVTINVAGASCKEPWYAQINPNQRVPSIDDDGVVMWESAAINLWLAEKYRSPLWPSDAQGKARMLQWAFYVANDVEQGMVTVMQHRVLFPPEKRNAALADASDAMADFMVASVGYSMWFNKFPLLGKFPKFSAWLDASVNRPAAKEARKLRE